MKKINIVHVNDNIFVETQHVQAYVGICTLFLTEF